MSSRAGKPSVLAKKSLGQNFLVDMAVLDRIVDACAFNSEETVLEIGPGQGVLTRAVAPYVKNMIAVEKDKSLMPALEQEFMNTHVHVENGDILTYDFNGLPPKIKVIGNLPYYISSPIINRVIESREHFSELLMTVQWEFAERLCASPGTKQYGSLSCFVQFYAKPAILFKIGKRAFSPRPKVDSCFMRLTLRDEPLFPDVDERLLFALIRQAFSQRRKKLLNAVQGMVKNKKEAEDVLLKAGIDPASRAEEISIEGFVRMARVLSGYHSSRTGGEA